jgi:hypothetical protein
MKRLPTEAAYSAGCSLRSLASSALANFVHSAAISRKTTRYSRPLTARHQRRRLSMIAEGAAGCTDARHESTSKAL